MNSYLEVALQQPQSDHQLQPISASKAFASPLSSARCDVDDNHAPVEDPKCEEYLTGTEEDYFLGLFWQSYHCTLQILDEANFREHYKSLWASNRISRRSSALVDMVLALCMQYGTASTPPQGGDPNPTTGIDSNDATLAGRWHYRRCHKLLTLESENPSISTVQCHIFSAYYLCIASYQNMAYVELALAVRVAQILGLHLEPSEDMMRAERELRKRIWWTLCALESKTCMKLGRPSSVQLSQVICSLPADDHDLALLSGSNFASLGENVTWLTYTLQNSKLVLASNTIHVAFYEKCATVLGANGIKSLYDDTQSLEVCAESLSSSMDHLKYWSRNVPEALKVNRKGDKRPFSTEVSAIDLERFAPLWLQRQRLLLELLYHNLTMNLYRPFIPFSPASTSNTPISEENAILCANHAIILTHIMHQTMTETEILRGWHEAYQWQWNAALSMIGYILAYPVSPSTSSVRIAIDSAIVVFEEFGKSFAVATSAADVTRNLTAKADILMKRFRMDSSSLDPSISHQVDASQANQHDLDQGSDPNENSFTFSPMEDGSCLLAQNAFVDPMDLAFAIDSFSGFEPLWGNGGDI